MNVLIIGNGFDIAHKLPTQYTSFLKFIEFINKFEWCEDTFDMLRSDNEKHKFSKLVSDVLKYISEVIEDDTNKDSKVVDIWTSKKSADDKCNRIKYIEEMIRLSKDNVWIKWFQKQYHLNTNWVDFEAEISRVVQEVEKMIPKLPLSINEISQQSDFQRMVNKIFLKRQADGKTIELTEPEVIKSRMLNDLNNLIRCFEIYLEDCVRNIDKQIISPDIYDLRIDCLLSFNYTDTYERLYSCKNRNIEYDYIHGKSKIDSKLPNNMVLGIDDYLVGEERFRNTNFIEFKKYFQRLQKKTGCTYKKWIEEINSSKANAIHNIYIFGHSLAMTDKDILTEFITNKKTRITIYYFNEKSYSDQIINLVHMIGPDTLNSMVYGTNPKIIFKPQSEMISKSDSEWEILNDCNKLWNIHNFGDSDIEKILDKIKEKLNTMDTDYFHSQENVISLYDAIVLKFNTQFALHDEFIRVAELLYKPEKCTIFNSDDWTKYDFLGHPYFIQLTDQLITDINALNHNIKSKVENSICSDDMELLFKKLVYTDITEEDATKLFDDIFEKFKSSDDCTMIWKCIYKIQKKCPDFDWRSFIENKIETANPIDIMRYRHFLDEIDEREYYEEMARSQIEDDES